MNLIGQTIGSFTVEAELCPSRWGKVYRAMQRGVDRTVALKVLSPELAAQRGRAEHFLETMRATARLIHAHVVTIYEAGHLNGIHYCGMEYMDGPKLADFLHHNYAVNERHLLHTIAAVARLLDYLWQRNIIHQPPALPNILVNSQGQVKLINVLPLDLPASQTPQEDIVALGALLAQLANDISPVRRPVSEIVERMVGTHGRTPFTAPAELAVLAADLEHDLFPPPGRSQPYLRR